MFSNNRLGRGRYAKMLGVNIYLAVVKRDLTNITMDLVRVKYILGIYNRLLINSLQAISQKYGHNL